MQAQHGDTTSRVVQALRMLAAAPDLAYLKDATPEVQMLQDFFKQAQQPPEPSNTPGILQVGVTSLAHLHCCLRATLTDTPCKLRCRMLR